MLILIILFEELCALLGQKELLLLTPVLCEACNGLFSNLAEMFFCFCPKMP